MKLPGVIGAGPGSRSGAWPIPVSGGKEVVRRGGVDGPPPPDRDQLRRIGISCAGSGRSAQLGMADQLAGAWPIS
jgi:hypothetical protein